MDEVEVKLRVSNFLETLKTNPTIRYVGVTKLLSATKDMTGLNEWRERVGSKEADAIVKQSVKIGNDLDYRVMNTFDKSLERKVPETNTGLSLYKQLKPHLERIDCLGTQIHVWSPRLRVQGALDILGYKDKKLTVFDVKNVRKTTRPEYVEDYFIQCTMYSMCLFDLLGLEVKDLMLLIGDRSDTKPQIFRGETRDYVAKALDRAAAYHALAQSTRKLEQHHA